MVVRNDIRNSSHDSDNRKKDIIVKTIIMLLLSFIVFIFAAVAWFAMNKNTTASGMGVTAAELPFELAVSGDNIGAISYVGSGTDSASYTGTPINDFSGAVNALDGDIGTYTYITDITSGTTASGSFYTTGSTDAIKWRLESEYDRYSDGMGPDSQGSFTFYVVPKKSGTLTVKFLLDFEGYTADVEQNEDKSWNVSNLVKIEPSDTGYEGVTYLNTHLLFFENRSENIGTPQKPVYTYSNLIENGEFERTFTNCVEDQLIPITIYWIWPNTIAQMSCVASSGNVATASGTVSDLQQYVVDNAGDLLKGITQAEAMTYMADETTEGGETTYTFNRDKANANLLVLSNGYNKADSSIGTNVNYFLLVLSAE